MRRAVRRAARRGSATWAVARSASNARSATRSRACASGVSIGIQDSLPQLEERVAVELASGYRRIKIKIKPGWDIDAVRTVRARFGDVPLMVDANAAYGAADAPHLARLDEFELMMIEQPLDYDDIADHARLQARLRTPVCLDESIHSARDARVAIEAGACRIVNIKPDCASAMYSS